MDIVFLKPFYLWFLLAIPILIFSHFLTIKYGLEKALKFANFEAIERVTKGYILSKPLESMLKKKNLMLLTIRIFIIIFLIFAVSETILHYKADISEFDFVLVIDASSSMLADDFKPNRLEAAKKSAIEFIDNVDGHIGLVSFSGTSFVEEEITDDMFDLKQKVNSIEVKKISGTDFGSAITTASNLFEGNKGKSIILLTDGQSNVGMEPEEAALYASEKGIVVHTIGIGTEEGGNLFGVNFTSKIDEDSLKRISKLTGGNYYKATDEEELYNSYKDIASIKESVKEKNVSLAL